MEELEDWETEPKHAGGIAMAAAVPRLLTCVIVLVLLLTTISPASAADRTII